MQQLVVLVSQFCETTKRCEIHTRRKITEEQVIYRVNTKRYIAMGLLPAYYDCNDKAKKYDITKVPFSKYYRTYADYEADIHKALSISVIKEVMPDELYNKLRETALELGIVDD